ncbi:hypothetical protein [Segatella oulorum]|uniref:hypothetical protein n=1 Tax=Segatella oulorum TaxID=28136 RepID=UPI0012DD1F62|nr:hypothetical protein [Segatella oulorum]
METPLRGRSGGHTGAAPTISRVAPCPKGCRRTVRRRTNTRKRLPAKNLPINKRAE